MTSLDVNCVYRKPALILARCTTFEVCAPSCSSQLQLRLPDKDWRNIQRRFGIAGDATIRGRMGSGIVPEIVNWLNWKVTYQISLMPWLKAFEFLYESVEMDFVWIGLGRGSRPVGLWNQIGLVSATVNLNWVYFPSLVASAICRCQIRTISRS